MSDIVTDTISSHDVSHPEEVIQLPGEEKEDLPDQPPVVEEKPKEGKDKNMKS